MPDTDTPEQDGERLQKYLAHAGVASRRHAEELIASGAVSVNGQVVRELGTRVHPGTDEVRVRDQVVRLPQADKHLYILLNKPAGTVTTVTDPQGRPTVLDLLPAKWTSQRIYPIGRLDIDTEGLLLLTNDGDLALRLTHPRYALPKEYRAVVRGRPTAQAMGAFARGMPLLGEPRPTAPARAWIVDDTSPRETVVGVELHEGRKRQVRRMLEATGTPVIALKRVRVGPLTLGTLKPGAARELTPAEVAALRKAAHVATSQGQSPRPPASGASERTAESTGSRSDGDARHHQRHHSERQPDQPRQRGQHDDARRTTQHGGHRTAEKRDPHPGRHTRPTRG